LARLLLVEDEPTHRSFYRHFLAQDGYEIREAGSGGEAIRLAKSFCPSVVVLDLVLPDMDVSETISRLLAECGCPKIVINTGHESYRLDFRCWGADAFVVKSSDPSELRRTVKQVLSLRDTERESRN
jgi:DNA-binding response OmpR family regulator